MKRLTRNLLDRSQQAFTLSVEIFNKPTIEYRIEGFCFFYINAWELLVKARLVDTTGREQSIYYPKRRGQPRRSLSLRDALAKAVPDATDPVRRNVEQIEQLRDQATHLLIPHFEAVYAGLFQAGVINYVDHLRDWFGRTLGGRTAPPLLSLVWDLKDLEPKAVQKRYGRAALKLFQEHRALIEQHEKDIGDRRFSIPIEYKLVLTKKPAGADITLGAGPGGAIAGQIIEVPKDVSVTHPYTTKPAVEAIQKRLGADVRFTSHDFYAVLLREGVKKADSLLHFKLKQTGTHCYSEKLVEEVAEKVAADPEYLPRVRESYRRYLAKQ